MHDPQFDNHDHAEPGTDMPDVQDDDGSVAPTEDPRLVTDRAAREGLPPDFGPEERVRFVRQAFFRAHVIEVPLCIAAPPLLLLGGAWVIGKASDWNSALLIALGMLLGIAIVATWWFVSTRSTALEITNKRAVEHRGFFSRSRDEVLLDHIRNVTVKQSFYQRIVRIGSVGIASSGQAGTEIELRNLPEPQEIRRIIDLYRPLD